MCTFHARNLGVKKKTLFLAGSNFCTKFDPQNDFFKHRASYHFKTQLRFLYKNKKKTNFRSPTKHKIYFFPIIKKTRTLADFYTPRLPNDMKIRNHFGSQIWYRSLDPGKKTTSWVTFFRSVQISKKYILNMSPARGKWFFAKAVVPVITG